MEEVIFGGGDKNLVRGEPIGGDFSRLVGGGGISTFLAGVGRAPTIPLQGKPCE